MTNYQRRVARYGKCCPWFPEELIPDLDWWFFHRGREMSPMDAEGLWWEARNLRQKQRQEERAA